LMLVFSLLGVCELSSFDFWFSSVWKFSSHNYFKSFLVSSLHRTPVMCIKQTLEEGPLITYSLIFFFFPPVLHFE
jgi:hypothetical protein